MSISRVFPPSKAEKRANYVFIRHCLGTPGLASARLLSLREVILWPGIIVAIKETRQAHVRLKTHEAHVRLKPCQAQFKMAKEM
jgi:hypothetical protein